MQESTEPAAESTAEAAEAAAMPEVMNWAQTPLAARCTWLTRGVRSSQMTPTPAPPQEEGFDLSKYSMTITIGVAFVFTKILGSLGMLDR